MSRNARLAVSGVALTALLAVVAVASHAHRPGGGTAASTPQPLNLVFDYVASVMFVLFPLGVLVVIWAMAQGRHQRLLAGETNWLRTLAGLAIFSGLLAIAVYLDPQRLGHGLGLPFQSRSGQGKAVPLNLPHKHTAAYHHEFHWLPAAVVGAIVLGIAGAVAYAWVSKRRGGGEWEREAELAAALDEVLADSLDDLRAEPDPRRAVIRAYARMESTFAAYGFPRDESEAPLEYMGRVLDGLSVSAYSVRRLTQLFSRAKFSPHDVDAGMKEDAIEALVGLRAELDHRSQERAA